MIRLSNWIAAIFRYNKILLVKEISTNTRSLPRYAYGVCKVFTLCKTHGWEFKEDIETCDGEFFSLDELPELDMAKNTKEQIKMCFLAEKDSNWQTIFD